MSKSRDIAHEITTSLLKEKLIAPERKNLIYELIARHIAIEIMDREYRTKAEEERGEK